MLLARELLWSEQCWTMSYFQYLQFGKQRRMLLLSFVYSIAILGQRTEKSICPVATAGHVCDKCFDLYTYTLYWKFLESQLFPYNKGIHGELEKEQTLCRDFDCQFHWIFYWSSSTHNWIALRSTITIANEAPSIYYFIIEIIIFTNSDLMIPKKFYYAD